MTLIHQQQQTLIDVILNEQLCSCKDEVTALLQAFAEDNNEADEYWLPTFLTDYLGLDENDVVFERVVKMIGGDDDDNSEHKECDDQHADINDNNLDINHLDDNHHDDEMLGPGECELCERYVSLTKHHLIPRSTWPRIEPKLKNAINDTASQLDSSLQHLPIEAYPGADKLSVNAYVRLLLTGSNTNTCSICRPCHSAIHRIVKDNMTLALQYNTVDALLQNAEIYKFVQWNSKQRAGKYKR